jgi:hypothetical protein
MKYMVILMSFMTTTFLLTASALLAAPLATNPKYPLYILVTCLVQVVTFVYMITLKNKGDLK